MMAGVLLADGGKDEQKERNSGEKKNTEKECSVRGGQVNKTCPTAFQYDQGWPQ
jgi:hypothetical protein